MKGTIFITRYGYDPQLGRHVKDPYLGDVPSIGACQTKFRKELIVGDHLFVVTGKVRGADANQLVLGGFEVERKIDAVEAYHEFPERRLKMREDGQLDGNIIVDEQGRQHPLDNHNGFDRRIKNYIVGTNPIALVTDSEIQRGREQTMDALCEILKRDGKTPHEVLTRFGRRIDGNQIADLRSWLASLKDKSTVH